MRRLVKPLIGVLGVLPLVWLTSAVLTGRTSANPAEDIILTTGIWSLRFLLASLAITPLRRLTGWNVLIQYRRMLGLFAFFYACVHLAGYLAFDRFFAFDEVFADLAKRPFITAGMVAFALMVPLAITSTRGWIRSLGRRWQLLHRLVYVSAIAAVIHYLWKIKADSTLPLRYALLLGVLLGLRLWWLRRRLPRPAPAAPAPLIRPGGG